MIELILAASIALSAQDQQQQNQQQPQQQEPIHVGGYTEDGRKVDTYQEQVDDAMQKRIDKLNEDVKKLEKDDYYTGPDQQVYKNKDEDDKDDKGK